MDDMMAIDAALRDAVDALQGVIRSAVSATVEVDAANAALATARAALHADHPAYALHVWQDRYYAQRFENERLRVELGHARMCVACGKVVDAAAVKRGDALPECTDRTPGTTEGYAACTFDTTLAEAGRAWRDSYYVQRTEIERLRAALRHISLGAQNSTTTKEDLGRTARAAIEPKETPK